MKFKKELKNLSTDCSYDRDNKDLVVSMIIGAAVGGILALLFAPDSGKGTRSHLSESFNQLGSSIKDKAVKGKNKLSEIISKKEGA